MDRNVTSPPFWGLCRLKNTIFYQLHFQEEQLKEMTPRQRRRFIHENVEKWREEHAEVPETEQAEAPETEHAEATETEEGETTEKEQTQDRGHHHGHDKNKKSRSEPARDSFQAAKKEFLETNVRVFVLLIYHYF